MSPTRQTLHNLIDIVDISEINILYHLLMKFVPEDAATPDEIESIARANIDVANGDVYKDSDINWG